MGQVDQPVVQSAPDQIPNESTTTISADNPRELSMFFIIGIAINVIVIASFAFWFSKEWSKKRHSGDRE